MFILVLFLLVLWFVFIFYLNYSISDDSRKKIPFLRVRMSNLGPKISRRAGVFVSSPFDRNKSQEEEGKHNKNYRVNIYIYH